MLGEESSYTSKIFILRSMDSSIPRIHASYSSMLLVQVKHNLVVKGIWNLVGKVMTPPIPCHIAFEAPSNTSVHHDSGLGPSLGLGVS